MIRFVLDASVGLAWFLDRPIPPLAQRAREVLVSNGRALVPALWHLEVANGLAMAERRGLLGPSETGAFLDEFERMCAGPIETRADVVPTRRILDAARDSRLSAYDAVYFEMARVESLPLATLDGDLRRAAARAGVELFR